MRNKENWTPSRFIFKNGKLVASRNTSEVGIGSRLVVTIVAQFYQAYIPRHVKGRLLDLGCGKVPLYEMYRDYIVDNCCVDWKKTFHGNKYLDLTCDLSSTIPIPDNQFETIILSDVLEHLTRPEKLWEEMFRLLTPGGKVLLNVPFLYWVHEAPYDYYRYTEFSLKRFAESSGFKVILLEPIGGAPEVLSDILSKFLLRYSLCQWISASIQSLSLWSINTKTVRRISEKTSKSFPMGYFMIAEKPSGMTEKVLKN